MEKRPFTSWLPVAEVAPLPLRPASVMAAGKFSSDTSRPLGGGVWPPPVTFPARPVTSPDLGKFSIILIHFFGIEHIALNIEIRAEFRMSCMWLAVMFVEF